MHWHLIEKIFDCAAPICIILLYFGLFVCIFNTYLRDKKQRKAIIDQIKNRGKLIIIKDR